MEEVEEGVKSEEEGGRCGGGGGVCEVRRGRVGGWGF